MNANPAKKIVLLGMMTKMPVAGIVYLTMQYLVGLKRLGYEPYYVEAHGRTPSMFVRHAGEDGSARAAQFIAEVMHQFDFDGQWAFHARHADGHYYGMSETELLRLYRTAELILNLHGGTEPLPEHSATGRLVYIGTDPCDIEIELYHNEPRAIQFLEPHCAIFTWGENYGNPDCLLPVSERFAFLPTRQPVVPDLWEARGGERNAEVFTTIGNWEQPWRKVMFRGELYEWSKHYEFLKFIDLPRYTAQSLELALASCRAQDKQLLKAHGWRVRDALQISQDRDAYRDYICHSRGEFTVAKDQNVRLRSGWFSDRSAAYLAAGRPVITQETGFSNVLPTGAGLFGFSTRQDIKHALDSINADYETHRRAAFEIAQEYFRYDKVLERLLAQVGTARAHKTTERPFSYIAGHPLPRGEMRVKVEAQVPRFSETASRVHVSCKVENLASVPFETRAPHPVHLSYKWLYPESRERVSDSEGKRVGFESPLMPRVPCTVSAEIQTPPQAGKLILRLTLVQEHVAWFDDVDPRNSYEALVELVHPAVKAIEPMPQAGVAV
jgi:hypothetical protein